MRKIVLKVDDSVTDEQAMLMGLHLAKESPGGIGCWIEDGEERTIERFRPFIIHVRRGKNIEILVSKEIRV